MIGSSFIWRIDIRTMTATQHSWNTWNTWRVVLVTNTVLLRKIRNINLLNSRFYLILNVLLWWAVHESPNWRFPDCLFCTLQSFSLLRGWPHGVSNLRSLRVGWTRFLGSDSVFWKHSHDWLVIVVKWRRVWHQPRPFRWFSAWCD